MAQHPPFPKQPPAGQYITHIWAYRLLKVDAAMSRLQKLGNSAELRTTKTATGTGEAIWVAMSALSDELHLSAQKAQRDGQLLFAWHGTNATLVGQERLT
jgi:hypothetical protein